MEGHPSVEGSPKSCMKLSQIWVAYFRVIYMGNPTDARLPSLLTVTLLVWGHRAKLRVKKKKDPSESYIWKYPISLSHIWLRKALEPKGQIVDCCTTAWIPYWGVGLASKHSSRYLHYPWNLAPRSLASLRSRPSGSATIHSVLFGLMSFAKPDMA